MKNKRSVLITIIVLLVIFLPLTVVGFIFKDDKSLLEENPGHDFYYKGYLWFYDNNDKLLSKYECQNKLCELAVPMIDDAAYGINYYKDGNLKKVSVIDDRYTFITDGALIYLFDVSNGLVLESYKSLKTYNVNLANNLYIVQNKDGLWGVLGLNKTGLSRPLNFEYDFIGLKDDVNNGVLNTNKFIVLKNSKWYIIDNTNNSVTSAIDSPIVDYTNYYIFSKNIEKVKVYGYDGYEYLTQHMIKDYILEDKYIGIIANNSLYIYDNLGTNYLKRIIVTNDEKITLEKTDNKLNVISNSKIIESIELN